MSTLRRRFSRPEAPLQLVDVTDMPCVEIDFPEDYELARTSVLSRFGQA